MRHSLESTHNFRNNAVNARLQIVRNIIGLNLSAPGIPCVDYEQSIGGGNLNQNKQQGRLCGGGGGLRLVKTQYI